MQTAIQSADFTLTRALKSFINDQVGKTMRGSAEHVEKLTVRLKDINGPKGGDDKECCVEIRMAEQAPVVVKKRSSDAYVSIRSALARASRTTLRRLRKKRSDKRQLNSSLLNKEHSDGNSGNNSGDGYLFHDTEIALHEYSLKPGN